MAYTCSIVLLLTTTLFFAFPPPSSPLGFNCTTTTTTTHCQSLVSFTPATTTNLSSVQSLFGIKHLLHLLSANNLAASTPANTTVEASRPIRVPFNCSCSPIRFNPNQTGAGTLSRTGLSLYKRPIYTVHQGDTLYGIANQVFSGLVTVQDLQVVNGIANASFIEVGERLWVPLPCSCDEVEGEEVVHLGHVVGAGSSVADIAAEYGVAQSTLMAVNGIGDARELKAGQVLDVPLRGWLSIMRKEN